MKLVLLSVTYFPEKKSASFMLQALCEDLIKEGHQVDVITFSDWIKSPHQVENINGVNIHRIKVPKDNGNKLKRALIELSYSNKIIRYVKRLDNKKFQGLIFYSPSIFFGKAVKYIKRNWSVDSYLIIRDIFPDWTVNIGLMKKGLIYRFFKHYEREMILNSDYIGVESRKDIEYCMNISPNATVKHLMNWIGKNEEFYISNTDIVSKEKINMIYGGVLGLAQDFRAFLKDLSLYPDINKKLRIIIIGDGDEALKVQEYANNLNLDIVIFGSMDKKEYMNIVQQCQIGLIVLNKKLEANNYPGKSFDYMYFSKPIFAYLNDNNEFGKLIEEENLGYYICDIKNNFEKSLVSVIEDEEERKIRGNNAKNSLNSYFSVANARKSIVYSFNNKKG